MAYLTWTSNLDTGIEVIDGQHKRIVDYINQLHDAKLTENRKIIQKVIDDMVDYTVSHFGFEETLIEDAGYEFTRPHKRVNEYKQRFDAGEDVTEELHSLLSRWLFNHILNDDAAYVKAVKTSLNMLTSDNREGGWLSRSFK
ncbi:MAG: bacteriohemerythrin, partial [Candidatus Thiodiazotropha sp.]